MRLISSRSWRWSFSWRFQRSSTSTFRSCVARHFCLQNFSRPSTNYTFFCWRCSRPSSVMVSNKKIYTKDKININSENNYKRNTTSNLDYFFPGNSARKWGLLTVKSSIKVRLDSQAYKSTVVAKGPFFP
jgi:hypothetical protein